MHLVSILLSARSIAIWTDNRHRVYIGCKPILYAIFVVLFAVCIARYCGLGTNDNRAVVCRVYTNIMQYYKIYTYTSYRTSPLKNERCYIKYLVYTISITYFWHKYLPCHCKRLCNENEKSGSQVLKAFALYVFLCMCNEHIIETEINYHVL